MSKDVVPIIARSVAWMLHEVLREVLHEVLHKDLHEVLY